jgi:hypothetical protein
MLTKQGVSLWSNRPPAAGYRSADVSEQTARSSPPMAGGVVAAGPGPATVATYTVLAAGAVPAKSVVIADRADGTRAIATSSDTGTAEAMVAGEWCGGAVDLDAEGGFSPR